MPEQSPFARLYRLPFVRDEEAMDLLIVKLRQFQHLIKQGRIERAGLPRFHRITCASLRRYLCMPDIEPSDCSPWLEMLSEVDSEQRNAVERDDAQSDAKQALERQA
jgi:hypothetical protein